VHPDERSEAGIARRPWRPKQPSEAKRQLFILRRSRKIYFAAQQQIFIFERRNPATRKWQGCSVLVVVEIGNV
jgi:hypothetical protein